LKSHHITQIQSRNKDSSTAYFVLGILLDIKPLLAKESVRQRGRAIWRDLYNSCSISVS